MGYRDYIRQIPQWLWDSSDGCTLSPNIKHKKCCVLHDYLLIFKRVDRKQADKLARDCIKDQYSNKLLGVIIAYTYYLGMRIGDWINYKGK